MGYYSGWFWRNELLDPKVALEAEKELLRLDNFEEGEDIDIDELTLSEERM